LGVLIVMTHRTLSPAHGAGQSNAALDTNTETDGPDGYLTDYSAIDD